MELEGNMLNEKKKHAMLNDINHLWETENQNRTVSHNSNLLALVT